MNAQEKALYKRGKAILDKYSNEAKATWYVTLDTFLHCLLLDYLVPEAVTACERRIEAIEESKNYRQRIERLAA